MITPERLQEIKDAIYSDEVQPVIDELVEDVLRVNRHLEVVEILMSRMYNTITEISGIIVKLHG